MAQRSMKQTQISIVAFLFSLKRAVPAWKPPSPAIV